MGRMNAKLSKNHRGGVFPDEETFKKFQNLLDFLGYMNYIEFMGYKK